MNDLEDSDRVEAAAQYRHRLFGNEFRVFELADTELRDLIAKIVHTRGILMPPLDFPEEEDDMLELMKKKHASTEEETPAPEKDDLDDIDEDEDLEAGEDSTPDEPAQPA